MILTPNNSQFYIRFPKNFFNEETLKRYNKFIEQYPVSFKDMKEVINHTIQKISLPKLNVAITEPQQTGAKFPPVFKKGRDVLRDIDRSFNITFKHIEGFLNYFFFLENIIKFNDHVNKEAFLPDLELNILLHERQQLYKVVFKQVLYKGIGESIDFSYTDVKNTASFFSINFAYNDISLTFDNEDIYK